MIRGGPGRTRCSRLNSIVFLISLDEIVRLGWICSVYWDAEGGETFSIKWAFNKTT